MKAKRADIARELHLVPVFNFLGKERCFQKPMSSPHPIISSSIFSSAEKDNSLLQHASLAKEHLLLMKANTVIFFNFGYTLIWEM